MPLKPEYKTPQRMCVLSVDCHTRHLTIKQHYDICTFIYCYAFTAMRVYLYCGRIDRY